MRSMLWNVVSGVFFAACLIDGLPVRAMELTEDATLVDPEWATGTGSVIWKRQLGTPDDDYALGVATDKYDNVLIGGGTYGSLAGPDSGYFADAFVAKYDGAGKLLWKRQLGTPELDVASRLAADDGGNVVTTGWTDGSLGGPNQGDLDAFVAKYSADGKLLWKRQLGTPYTDVPNDVATDKDGNVVISGLTDGSLGGPTEGSADVFVAKYSADGKLLWKRQFGTPYTDVPNDVATDKDGNVVISGLTASPPGSSFVVKYSPRGKLLWRRNFDTPCPARSVATDGASNVLIIGSSPGGPQDWGGDAFVAKYNLAGKLLWKRQFGTPEGDYVWSVAADADGNVLISGDTYGSLGGPNQGGLDAFVVKYSALGKLLWKRQFGTTNADGQAIVASDTRSNVLISGYTYGSLGGPGQGFMDAFVIKFRP